MTQEEIRLRCFKAGCAVRGGEVSQLAAVGTIVDWVGGDEFRLSCLEASIGQGITGKGLIDRAESILKFCKNEPDKPAVAPARKTSTRGGKRTR